jgi:hypothetical protein
MKYRVHIESIDIDQEERDEMFNIGSLNWFLKQAELQNINCDYIEQEPVVEEVEPDDAPYEYKPSDVAWSLYYSTKDSDAANWVERNEVGSVDDTADNHLLDLPDGEYVVEQGNWHTGQIVTLKNKVQVKNGKFNIETAQIAIAEFLNENDDWHYFIEAVIRVPGKPNTITFHLGS